MVHRSRYYLAGWWAITLFLFATVTWASEPVHYQLYKNPEHYGIVVFPEELSFQELEGFLASLGFEKADRGEAIMRFGEKRENMTYMMPREVQEKHKMQKFLTLQILGGQKGLMVGIYEQEFGLTLPPKIFTLEEVKENIPKTLDLFRDQEGRKKINLPVNSDQNFLFRISQKN